MNFFDDVEKVGDATFSNNIGETMPNKTDIQNENKAETIEPDILEIVKKLVIDNVNLEQKLTEIFNKLEPQTEKEIKNENWTDL